MLSAAAGTLTGELRMNLWHSSANTLVAEQNAILQTLSEGIMLLRADTTISQINARAGHVLACAQGHGLVMVGALVEEPGNRGRRASRQDRQAANRGS